MQQNFDVSPLENAVIGLGDRRRDPHEATKVRNLSGVYGQETLDAYYTSSWACRRVVEIMPRLMTRKWGTFTLGGDKNDPSLIEYVHNRHKQLQVRKKFKKAQYWANLYGQCNILMLVDDETEDYSQPVEESRIAKIKKLIVLDRYKLYPEGTTAYERLDPEYYTLATSISSNKIILPNSLNFKNKVHKTRVLPFIGNDLPDTQKSRNAGCEASVLEPFIDVWERFFTSYAAISRGLIDFNIFVHYMDGLFEKLWQGGKEAEEKLKNRLQINQTSKSLYKGYAADLSKEKLEILSRNFSGVGDVADRLKSELVAASGLPGSVLFGEFAAGLDASGKITGEQRYLNDLVEEGQQDKFSDNIDALNSYLLQEDEVKSAPTSYGFLWHPLYTESPKEKADIFKVYAEADKINIEDGVYSQEEARTRHEGDSFRTEITLQARADRFDALRLADLEKTGGRVRYKGKLYAPNKPYKVGDRYYVLATKNGYVQLVTFSPSDVNTNLSAENPHSPTYWANLYFSFAPNTDSEDDAPNYRKASGDSKCVNCQYSYSGNSDGTGWLNCDKFDFEVKRDYVCDDWTLRRKNLKSDDATRAQKILEWQGFKIGVQYFPFQERHGKVLKSGYGFFQKTKGADGMAVDVYIGVKLESSKIFAVEQLVNGEFDEEKMVIGVDNIKEAKEIYLSAMPLEFFGGIKEIGIDELKAMRTDVADFLTISGDVLSEEEFDVIATIDDEDIAAAITNWKQVAPNVYSNLLDAEVL
ncbi:hypothetical protein WA1_19085 [Scytonema hofmannii PCC 7110]|uniref:Uncharacterized protein n=1 Tax=Scytonema hofmannii PCC 7110 TaxID=128403 RepID=A0A139XBS9_9CYAN|nr:anti-CBASS Acb1 family protein [Scytonema hofmannii]KYC42106.1 hypothetical protein WA1_19085 [Scytonema hofmannii PCC 7110]